MAFFAVGGLSFAILLGLLGFSPGHLMPGAEQAQPLWPAQLVAGGLVGSVLFGASYLILPVLAATSLWSVRLGWLHGLLHVGGCLLLILSTAAVVDLHAVWGYAVISAGLVAYAVNLWLTAARFNRWDPAQLTLVVAVCWLGLVGLFSLWLFVDYSLVDGRLFTPERMQLQALMGLIGFFWLFLLGAALKMGAMFLVSKREPGAFSWTGLILLNLALLLIVPLTSLPAGDFNFLLGILILAGSIAYLIDLLRLAIGSDRMFAGDLAVAATGLMLAFAVLGRVVFRLGPWSPAAAGGMFELARTYFILVVTGAFILIAQGLAMRILPFLVWQLRFLPLAGKETVPAAEELIRPHGRWMAAVCLIAGWLYLAAGQGWGEAAGFQIAAVCFAVGTVWTLYTVAPALAVVCGRRLKNSGIS